MSTDRRMGKANAVYPHSGILLSHKIEQDTDMCSDMDGPCNHDGHERNQTQKITRCTIPIYVKCPEQVNLQTEQIGNCQN